MAEARAKIDECVADVSLEYVDGILFSPTSGAIVTGRLADAPTAGAPVRHFTRPRDPWFYMHVAEAVGEGRAEPVVESIPLEEYLFRCARGSFPPRMDRELAAKSGDR